MRLPSLSRPSSRQSQTVIGICLIVLTLFTAFAVSQALPRIQDKSDADNLAKRNGNIDARQLQGAPWGLPWGIFGGGQSASSVQPTQPAITTPLPAAVTVVGHKHTQGPLGVIGQILPTVIAPLTAAVGGVAAPVASVVPLGNALPSVVNAVPSLFQPGGLPGLPTAVPNAQGGQPPANGGLVPAVQSLVSIVLGAGGNAGSLVPLSGITGVLNPLTPPAGGVLTVSQATAVVGNGAPVINMPSQLPAMSIINNIPTVVSGLPSAIGLITALPANLPSIFPTAIPNLPVNPVVTNLNEVLGPVSVLLPLSSVLPVDISGLNAPQLPEDLTGAVPSILSSLAIVINQPATPASAVGDVDSQATNPLDAAGAGSCTMVRIANGTPAFVLTACPTGVSPAAPQTAVSSVSSLAAPSQLSLPVNSAGSPVSTREPVPSLQLPGGSSGTAGLPVTSQVTPFITLGNTPAGTPQLSSAATSRTVSANAISSIDSPSTRPGAGSQGSNGQPQNTNASPQPQPSAQTPNAPWSPTPAIPSPAASTHTPSQPNGGTTVLTPSAPATSPQKTLTIAGGTPLSNPGAYPPSSGNGQGPSPTQSAGSIFGVDDGPGSSPGDSVPPGTPVIPISDCPAVVQCPACPASPVKPPSGSCPCPGRGYSCSECLNGWFCPPQETPMQPAPCGMGWPCYHCKGGWYCAPDGSGMTPAGANKLPVVVITTVTAFVLPQPTGASSGGTPGGDGSGGGGSGNGSGGGSDGGVGSGNGNDDGNDNGNGDGNSGNAASTPCTTPGAGQPTVGAGSGSGNGSNSGSPIDPNDGSGNGSGGNGAGNNGGASGNGGADNAGYGNAVSTTPCTTDKNGQPTKAADSGNGNGDSSGNGAPNSPGNGGPASIPDGYGSSPAKPTTTNPNGGLGSGNGSGNGSPTPGGNGGSGSGDPNAGPGGGSPANAAPKAAAEVFGWAHLGCFKDSPIRTLDCDPSNYFAGSMSNEKCIAHCASKGFRLAGTEYGKECWCGNAFQLAVRIPEEECNEVCDGRSTDICGGDWAVTVYSASGQALSVSLDDDAGNGAGTGSGGSGSLSLPPAGPSIGALPGPPPGTPAPPATPAPLPASLPASPPQAPPQSQPPLAPIGISQPAPNPPPQPQIDVASLIKSILDALPKASPDGGYGSSLGARDSGASGNNGHAGPGNAGNLKDGTGGAPMMGPGPSNPEDGLRNYGMPKRDLTSRSVKRSSIIGRRAVAKFDGVRYGDEADGYSGDYVAEKA